MTAPRASFELTVAAPGQSGLRFRGADDGYRIDFEAAYGGDGEPPKSSMVIYNPPRHFAETVRSWGTSAVVTLVGGISGWGSGKIFSGRVVKDGVKVSKSSDYVLTLTCSSGQNAYVRGKISDSTTSSDTAQTVFQRLCAALGVQPGTLDLPDGFAAPERALYGTPIHQLEVFASSAGRRLVFDGESMHIMEMSTGIVGGNTPIFRPGSGLIGTPEATEKGFDVKLLIVPSMRVGSRFLVEYEDPYSEAPTRRLLVAREVRHVGSTHTSEIVTSVKARSGGTA